MEGTSGRKRVNEGALKLQVINVPDLPTQQKIATVLSSLDAKIEFNNRINTQLEAMAKTLYDYWFVQFDFPNANGKPYKSIGGKMVWNDGLKRDIPEGWEVGLIADWIRFGKNGDWGKEFKEGNYTQKVYCIRGADINGLNGDGKCNPPGRFILERNSHKTLESGDLIVEISGGSPTQSTGRMAYLTEDTLARFDAPVICSNFCKAITLKDEKYLYNFAYLWNSLYDNNVFFGYEGKTSGIKNFLFDSFTSSYLSVIPKKDIVERFYEWMLPIQSKKQNALKENQKLIELREWLLPMLINGQVKVADDIEEQLSIAAEPAIPYNIQSKTLQIPERKKTFAKQVLGGKIVSLFKDDPHFTRIKFQKLQYLAEHIAEADLLHNYYFQAAGPYDNIYMHTIAEKFRQSKWFHEQNYKFLPLEKQSQIEEYYTDYFGTVSGRLDQLFSLMADVTEAEAEIIATLYAVWNNRIILKQPVTEAFLIEDFYNWSDRKHKYLKEQVLEGLQWLTTNKMEPNGFGKIIKRAKAEKKSDITRSNIKLKRTTLLTAKVITSLINPQDYYFRPNGEHHQSGQILISVITTFSFQIITKHIIYNTKCKQNQQEY